MPSTMSHAAKPRRHQTPEHQKLAQTYALRIVIGKSMLVFAGGIALAAGFAMGTFGSPAAIGVLAFGGACVVAFFIGDFPASVRCPGCGRRMKVRTHQDPHPHKRFRYLECPGCGQTIDLTERR